MAPDFAANYRANFRLSTLGPVHTLRAQVELPRSGAAGQDVRVRPNAPTQALRRTSLPRSRQRPTRRMNGAHSRAAAHDALGDVERQQQRQPLQRASRAAQCRRHEHARGSAFSASHDPPGRSGASSNSTAGRTTPRRSGRGSRCARPAVSKDERRPPRCWRGWRDRAGQPTGTYS